MSTPRFLADENLRQDIVLATRRLEPSLQFITAVDAGLSKTSDDVILARAHKNGWLIVSHDKSTMIPHAEARIRDRRGVAGLFVVPQYSPRRAVSQSLVLIWAASQAEEWRDRIVFLPL